MSTYNTLTNWLLGAMVTLLVTFGSATLLIGWNIFSGFQIDVNREFNELQKEVKALNQSLPALTELQVDVGILQANMKVHVERAGHRDHPHSLDREIYHAELDRTLVRRNFYDDE